MSTTSKPADSIGDCVDICDDQHDWMLDGEQWIRCHSGDVDRYVNLCWTVYTDEPVSATFELFGIPDLITATENDRIHAEVQRGIDILLSVGVAAEELA